MVRPQFAELHVKGDGFGALRRKFLDQPAIDLTRPLKPILVSQPPALDGAMLESSMATKARLVATGAGKCRAVRARKS